MSADQLIEKLTKHKEYRASVWYSPKYMAQIRAIYVRKHGARWDPQFQQDVREGLIRIGMTKEMVLASWGQPRDINRSVGSWGVNEQWVYAYSQYLYFENGKLESFQD